MFKNQDTTWRLNAVFVHACVSNCVFQLQQMVNKLFLQGCWNTAGQCFSLCVSLNYRNATEAWWKCQKERRVQQLFWGQAFPSRHSSLITTGLKNNSIFSRFNDLMWAAGRGNRQLKCQNDALRQIKQLSNTFRGIFMYKQYKYILYKPAWNVYFIALWSNVCMYDLLKCVFLYTSVTPLSLVISGLQFSKYRQSSS